MPEKVLLATDGSKDAALAARAAVDVCEGTDAELHVVHAWQSVPTACLRAFMRAELKNLGNELLLISAQTPKPPSPVDGCSLG
ncbi:MAG: universal stress protein [Actinomycetota bacterium]|nr:universal stress protein [Actinomycetota bacterium]